MQNVVVTAALILATATAARADIRASDAERLASAARAVQEIRGEIPRDVWTSARCMVVIPELKKAALVFGGEYGKGVTLASRDISAPGATPFLNALKSAPPPSSSTPAATDRGATTETRPSQANSAPATPRTTTMSTTDDELRARIVDMEQTLDRVFADTTPAPVGTTGTVGMPAESGMVTIERARLLQLRRQLEALLATLNRR